MTAILLSAAPVVITDCVVVYGEAKESAFITSTLISGSVVAYCVHFAVLVLQGFPRHLGHNCIIHQTLASPEAGFSGCVLVWCAGLLPQHH